MTTRPFILERVHASFEAAQKKVGTTSLSLVVLVATTTILVFGPDPGARIELLGLSLERFVSAEVALLVTMATAYRLVALVTYVRILRLRFGEMLAAEAPGQPLWPIAHPSLHIFQAGFLPAMGGLKRLVGLGALWFFNLSAFVWPIVLIVRLGVDLDFAWHWMATAVISLLLLSAGLVLFGSMGPGAETRAFLTKLDERDAAILAMQRNAPDRSK